MPLLIAVGVQWGDEGKGKIVDYLTERAKLVVRFQGGSNAGHTVVIEGKKTALRLLPSGILRPGTRCLLASGVVIDPEVLLQEIDALISAGVEVNPARFGIAPEAHIILPYHVAIDREREEQLQHSKIGTTGKGIGPAYEDVVARSGVRIGDLLHEEHLRHRLSANVSRKNDYLEGVLGSAVHFDPEVLLARLMELGKRLQPFVADVSTEVNNAVRAGEFVVFEGAQGSLLDVHHGTYPFVTSSQTLAGFACASGGFGPRLVDYVLGVCKAYATRVGGGPFPTEDSGADGETLRVAGHEFGTVTGRPRRCGWFDAVAARKAVRLNGIDSLIITKLDVLSGFPSIKVGTSYEVQGQRQEDLPAVCLEIDKVKVGYEELPGWSDDISKVRDFDNLPKNAKNYLCRIEAIVGCRVGGFSVGPDREQTIILDERLKSFSLHAR